MTSDDQSSFRQVLLSFKQYRTVTKTNFVTRISQINLLPQNLKEKVKNRFLKLIELSNFNAHLFNEIISQPVFLEQRVKSSTVGLQTDQSKVISTLKSLVRDWSEEGEKERKETYLPILNELENIFKRVDLEARGNIKVLVPGSGLGRLAFEIVSMGFSTQGNEFSYFMLVTSNYILNHIKTTNAFEIYPWIHQSLNMPSIDSQTKKVLIPDIVTANVPPTADFSMVGGDFVEVYASENFKEYHDIVVTCYFLDTAKNVYEYIKVIGTTLKRGGRWINLGPLLWHFENLAGSVEFTFEELIEMVKFEGFVIEKQDVVKSTYGACQESMMKYIYHNQFFVARKV